MTGLVHMKILVLSDLHAEHSPFQPDPEAVAASDVVVLAGDIHTGCRAASWARKTFSDKPIVLIAGNHELYDGHWTQTIDEIRASARRHDVHFLENDAVTVDGVQFLGATLWTDFMYFGANQMVQTMNEARRYMMDYRAIHKAVPPKKPLIGIAPALLAKQRASPPPRNPAPGGRDTSLPAQELHRTRVPVRFVHSRIWLSAA